jgi:hypothetical protein
MHLFENVKIDFHFDFDKRINMDIEFHEKYFEIIFSIIKKQNEILLKKIALQENIDGTLLKEFIPSKKEYKKWLLSHHHRQNLD